jgi:probable rRNA maturation factor
MRGRTLNDAFVILDEAQNTTIEQMKMFLTRIGFGSTAVITGDMTQIDLPKHVKSGLRDAIEVLRGVDGISFTFFESGDVVRHPLVARIEKQSAEAQRTHPGENVQAYERAHVADDRPDGRFEQQALLRRPRPRDRFRTRQSRDHHDRIRPGRLGFAMTKGPVRLDVAVGYATPRTGVPAATSFRRWVATALQGRIREADLAVRVVGENEGRALNRHYRGKDYATNVLSFPADMADGVKLPKGVVLPLMGDIVLCAPVVAREAAEQGKPVAHHYAHLTVHGVLHLLGMDHQDEREAECMEQLEREILAELEIADPYRVQD